tara:strand:- start:440 stop:628 length:189 start_codon:yes stop_codon:yes gene_type:complete
MSKYKEVIPYTESVEQYLRWPNQLIVERYDLIPNKLRKKVFKIKDLEWLLKYESRKEIKNNS